LITFDRDPDSYQHWRLSFDGPVATLALDVNEEAGIEPGYKLKLNSYDLGVDIELRDALERIRFEHPEVGAVVIGSAKERMFCAGANIYMLGKSSHAWKVNFCKFTNETRNSIEDSSESSGLKFLAAVNGTAAGGGYELALACDEILLVDDRSSAVSFPEVPLLAVLPGTGGLTRLVDKRKVRRDRADVFCTTAEGLGGARAKAWGLVDEIAPPRTFAEKVKEHALALAAKTDRPRPADGIKGIQLTPLQRTIDEAGVHYQHVDVAIDGGARTITITVNGPKGDEPNDVDAIIAAGAGWWPLAMARELDDAILHLRTNVRDGGMWVLKTRGDHDAVLRIDHALEQHGGQHGGQHAAHWLVRETVNLIRRTFARLEVSSRSIYAVIDEGSSFAGTLFELALAADRSYMLAAENGPRVALSAMNFGPLRTANAKTRLETRFGDDAAAAALRARIGESLDAEEAVESGLVTFAPDELDWEDELRLALEERTSLSPDALTGMEASLRFGGNETVATKIFGRLSAWQNWIFIRPNAVGDEGALKLFGSGTKPRYSWERV
jgi:benzoyl-CoA-dihydrodiol lyase